MADDLLEMKATKTREDQLAPEVQQALIRTAFAIDSEKDFEEEKEQMAFELDEKNKGKKDAAADLAG